MNPKKFEQRDFMLKQYAKSLSLKETVELTAAKFGCKKQSLHTDWARRPTWLKEICDFQNTDTHIRALVSSFPCLLKHLDDLIENADNSNCRLGAKNFQQRHDSE